MNAAARFDDTLRGMVLLRFPEFDAQLGPKLLREFIAELVGRLQRAGRLAEAVTDADMDQLTEKLRKEFAPILAAGPNQEDISRLMQKIVEKLASAEGGQKVALPRSACPEL